MKKIRTLILSLALVLSIASPAFAVNPVQSVCQSNGSASVCEASKGTNLLGRGGLITKLVSVFSYFAGVIAIIMMIVGGFKYVTSQGEASGLASAKSTIIYAIVGLLIAIFAQGIVQFVLSKL